MARKKARPARPDQVGRAGRKAKPAGRPKGGSALRKQLLVGLAIIGLVVAVALGLRYFWHLPALREQAGTGRNGEVELYAQGPAGASVVLREFSSFT